MRRREAACLCCAAEAGCKPGQRPRAPRCPALIGQPYRPPINEPLALALQLRGAGAGPHPGLVQLSHSPSTHGALPLRRSCEALVLGRIRAAFPDHKFIGEEGSAAQVRDWRCIVPSARVQAGDRLFPTTSPSPRRGRRRGGAAAAVVRAALLGLPLAAGLAPAPAMAAHPPALLSKSFLNRKKIVRFPTEHRRPAGLHRRPDGCAHVDGGPRGRCAGGWAGQGWAGPAVRCPSTRRCGRPRSPEVAQQRSSRGAAAAEPPLVPPSPATRPHVLASQAPPTLCTATPSPACPSG